MNFMNEFNLVHTKYKSHSLAAAATATNCYDDDFDYFMKEFFHSEADILIF